MTRVPYLYGGWPGHRPYEVAEWAHGPRRGDCTKRSLGAPDCRLARNGRGVALEPSVFAAQRRVLPRSPRGRGGSRFIHDQRGRPRASGNPGHRRYRDRLRATLHAVDPSAHVRRSAKTPTSPSRSSRRDHRLEAGCSRFPDCSVFSSRPRSTGTSRRNPSQCSSTTGSAVRSESAMRARSTRCSWPGWKPRSKPDILPTR